MPPRKKAATGEELSLDDIVAGINNRLGEGTITLASDPSMSVTRWKTGVFPIDDLLDGGLPKGRFVEVYGPYSTLKSYVAYKALGNVQREGGRVALVDTEHSFDPEWAEQLGVDCASLAVARPQTAEEAIEVMQVLIAQKYDLVVFDSIAAAQPKQYAEAAPGEDNAPGALARVMSRGLARLNAVNKHTAVICINQTRSKIGVSFGSPITTSGGVAMSFYASVRMSFTRLDKVKEPVQQWDGEKFISVNKITGHRIKVTLEKSKINAPYSDAIFVYDLRTGEVDERGYILAKALEAGIVTRGSTGMWDIPGQIEKPIHGKAKFDTFLDDNPDIVDWIKENL